MAHEVTQLLARWNTGDKNALDELIGLVYGDLRRMAAAHMNRERRAVTLQSTVLVHEVYLRLAGQQSLRWEDRTHFFAAAANLMRQILVDQVRRRKARKRGDGAVQISLTQAEGETAEPPIDIEDLDRALEALSRLDPQQGRIVELRYFAGLSVEETAEVLSISTATVKRDWAMAKAWLYHTMSANAPGSHDART